MPKRAPRPEDLLALTVASDVQLSPGGRWAAYLVAEIDADGDESRSRIWIVPTDSGDARLLTRGPKRDAAPRWSPDGRLLAFLSDREADKPQLYLMPLAGGDPRQLTALSGGAGPAVWSPDGRRIAFAARVDREAAPADADARKRWAERPKVVTRAQYKADGQGYVFDSESRIHVIDVESGSVRELTAALRTQQPLPLGSDDRAPAWSPDGRRIAFVRNRAGVGDYGLSDLWVMDADGSERHRLADGIGRATSPSWSPDGRFIACFGTDEQEPGLGEHLVRVWLVEAASGEARRLTAGFDRHVVLLPPPAITAGAAWAPDGRSLAAIFADAGDARIVRVRVPEGSCEVVVGGARQISFASLAGDRIAFCAMSPESPSDVYVCRADGSGERRLTEHNRGFLDAVELPKVERRRFATPNGEVDGWLVHPLDGSRPAPLLVEIHGGPHAFKGSAFPHSDFFRYVLAGLGWATISLNPTGSGSYGKAFAHGIRGRWGEHDLPEQLAVVDALVDEGVADPDRLAVTGYSYGGFMTSWTVGHTDRFRAAVVGAPVTNQESFFGTSDIGMWFAPWELRADRFDDPEAFRRLSPVQYADRVTTPTLVLHGEADDRCPIGQGEEFFIALVAAGKVPTEMVRYPGGSHLFVLNGRPSHRVDYQRRVVDWVQRYANAPRPVERREPAEVAR